MDANWAQEPGVLVNIIVLIVTLYILCIYIIYSMHSNYQSPATLGKR